MPATTSTSTTTTTTTSTTTTTTAKEIDDVVQFLSVPGRELCINNTEFLSSMDDRDEIKNDDRPVKCLQLEWNYGDGDGKIANDKFNVNLEVIRKLQNLEVLVLVRFPFASFSVFQLVVETNNHQPNNNNNNKDKTDDNNNDNSNLPTETTTIMETRTTPISIRPLSSTLKILTIKCCYHNSFHLPPDISMLVNLTELHLQNCPYLFSLPEEIGSLQHLETFELFGLSHLQTLPSEIGNLQNLKVLQISSCHSLVGLPTEIGNLKSLQDFKISHCDNFERLPTTQLNQLSGSLQTLEISDIPKLQLADFSIQICHFTKLRELKIQWYDYCKGMIVRLQKFPSLLEKLVLYGFYNKGLNNTTSQQTHQERATLETTSALRLYSLLDLLPSNIKELHIHDNGCIATNKKNQRVIHTFLHKFSRLSIYITSQQTNEIDMEDEKSLGVFTKQSLYQMFFNRCGRILKENLSSSVGQTQEQQQRSPLLLPLSMWPMVLENVQKRIGEMKNRKSEQIMEASVIYSLLQEGSVLLDRPVLAPAAVDCSLDDNIMKETETDFATTVPSHETVKNLKRPYPFS